MNLEFQSRIRDGILRDPDFVSAVFGGNRPQATPPWVKVTVKPVLLKQETCLQFQYFDATGNLTATPSSIRMVRATVVAKTSSPDPQLKDGDGYRRKQVASNIYLRNVPSSY